MSEVAITTRNLGKLYRLGETMHHDTLRDSIHDFTGRLLNRRRSTTKASTTLWALRDVCLDIERGEVVGVVGRNGAGKTTLLKILSRITSPSTGTAEIFGRIASLLEVGTGFHPELTGRENIFMNGAILGMSRREISNRFDEIVAFAEVEKFLDTPVKRYSSGMYVRLAFSVAAHLEPDILLVDEVLAVGDLAFQRKCLSRMGKAAKSDRTILFVSHNMASVQALCTRAILLDNGKLIRSGPTEDIINEYYQSLMLLDKTPLGQRKDRDGDQSVRLESILVESADPGDIIHCNDGLKITIRYLASTPIVHARLYISVIDMQNRGIFSLRSESDSNLPDTLPTAGVMTCITGPINLTPGRCYVNVVLFREKIMADQVQYAQFFDVEVNESVGSGKQPTRDEALCNISQQWTCEQA